MTSEPRDRDRSQQPAQKPVFLLGHGNAMQEMDRQPLLSMVQTQRGNVQNLPAKPPPPPTVQTGAAYLTVPLFTDLTREQELQEQVPQP